MADDLLARVLDDRIAIVGTSGSGKTYAARGLVERLAAAGARFCAVDPLGVWYGLRAGADGDQAGGLPVLILGGLHADVPVAEGDGAAVGALVAGSAIQCVVDVSELGSGAARRRFMGAFLEALYDNNRDPLHLVLDEADLWAPQRPRPDQAALQGRVGEIVRRGRVRGFVPWLITQRPAVLDKDALSQADVLVAFKLTSSQDRAAIGAWIEGQADRAQERDILAALPKLARGTGYVWAPGREVLQLVDFPPNRTFDSSRTPRRGERAGKLGGLALVDAGAAAAALAAAREGKSAEGGAAAAANSKPVETPLSTNSQLHAAELVQARREGFAAGVRAVLGHVAEWPDMVAGRLAIAADQLVQDMRDSARELERPHHWAAALAELERGPAAAAQNLDKGLAPPASANAGSPAPAGPESAKPAQSRRVGAAGLNAAAARLLEPLVRRFPSTLTWRQVATLAGLAPQGGYLNGGVKQLRELGLVAERDGQVCTTAEGIQRSGATPDGPTSRAELVELWAAKLPGPAPGMLRALAQTGPMPPAELAAMLGIKPIGGHWNRGVAALRRNNLAELRDGQLHLTEAFDA